MYILRNAQKMIVAMAAIALLFDSSSAEEPDIALAITQAKSLSVAFRHAAEEVSPSVVTVLVETDEPHYALAEDGSRVPYFEDDEEESVGSGVIIHAKGYVLSNAHVIAKATQIIVRLADRREYKVARVKVDKLSDIALLILADPPSDLKAARLGNSSGVSIGDWVIAIGSPYEYATTVSAGIISGKNRSLKQIRRGKLLQTDAAINPGNSGGPLVSLDGEVIAINTAIASSSGGYEGIGFAIPINHAKWVLKQLAKHGRVRRSYLGVDIRDIEPTEAKHRGLRQSEGGVMVKSVNAPSPAATAGLRRGDVIVRFGPTRVRDSRDLQSVVEQQPVGSSHPITFIRDGRESTLSVIMEPLPSAGTDRRASDMLVN